MAVYVDNFSCQDWERPARPVRQKMRHDLNKTAVNKGVWEFGTELLGPPGPPAATHDELQPVYPGSLWSLPPQIVIAIP